MSKLKNVESFDDLNMGCASAIDAEAWEAAGVHEIISDDGRPLAGNPGLDRHPMVIDTYNRYILPVLNQREALRPGVFTAQNFQIDEKDMLSDSAKLAEAANWGWYTPGLYLASGTLAGTGEDACPFASCGCRENCLIVSGQRAHDLQEGNTEAKSALYISKLLNGDVQGHMGPSTALSLLKTWMKKYNEPEFNRALYESIRFHQAKAERKGHKYGVRLNATSDLPWERFSNVFNDFPEVVFYDYTKYPNRMMEFLAAGGPDMFFPTEPEFTPPERKTKKPKMPHAARNPNVDLYPEWPSNYHLSFSFSEINLAWCLVVLAHGGNIVVPFDDTLDYLPQNTWEFDVNKKDKAYLPEHFLGFPVIDGDAYDMRFMDNDFWGPRLRKKPPFIVGLRMKGQYQAKHESMFFFSAAEAEAISNQPDYQAMHLEVSVKECMRQRQEGCSVMGIARTGKLRPYELPKVGLFTESCQILGMEHLIPVYRNLMGE